NAYKKIKRIGMYRNNMMKTAQRRRKMRVPAPSIVYLPTFTEVGQKSPGFRDLQSGDEWPLAFPTPCRPRARAEPPRQCSIMARGTTSRSSRRQPGEMSQRLEGAQLVGDRQVNDH